MASLLVKYITKTRVNSKLVNKTTSQFSTTTNFPRESEGNVYSVNWSLVVDGVVPVGKAYCNARIPLLASRLSAKVEGGKVELSSPAYTGKYKLLEAGDVSLSQEAFSVSLKKIQDHLSSGPDLYAEDASLAKVGVRVITDNPAAALIVRGLMSPSVFAEIDHRARFDGWNMESRWINPDSNDNLSKEALPAQRPIVACYGGPGDTVAIQFCESNKKIVGANVVVGGTAPIRGLIDAIGLATTIYINSTRNDILALPSTCISKGSNTVIIVGADDSVVDAATSKNVLYGAYHHAISKNGVFSLWNSYIGNGATSAGDIPSIVIGGKSVKPLAQKSAASSPTSIIFFEAGATKKDLTEDEALKKVLEITDSSKSDVAKGILSGKNICSRKRK